MEGLSIAANVIAAVDLSAKVASLCFQYSKHAKNAKDDIDRLHREATNLKNVSKNVQKLLNGPDGRRLEGSQKLIVAVEDSLSKLQRLEQELRPGITRKAMSRVGFRALKWPFRSNDVERTVQDLMRCTQAISLALQVDQTFVANHVDDLKYFVMTNQWASRSNPDGFLRTYRKGQTTHHEVYSFFKPGWEDTDFFLDYARGHIDNDYEEVPTEEAEQLIHEKLRRKAEREQTR